MPSGTCDLVFSLQEFLKIVPGIAILPLSLYLAWRKIGVKILASISTSHGIGTAPRISGIVLRNMKDKPFAVFSIYALINNKIYYKVEDFDPPIIVGSLESARVETRPYSQLSLGADKFEPDFMPPNKIDIYLVCAEKLIKCKRVSHPDAGFVPALKRYRLATREVRTFNGVVYDDDAAYAIIYRLNSNLRTAIAHRSGFICRNWDFWFNAIPSDHMKSEEDVRRYLEAAGLGNMVEYYHVHSLNKRNA